MAQVKTPHKTIERRSSPMEGGKDKYEAKEKMV